MKKISKQYKEALEELEYRKSINPEYRKKFVSGKTKKGFSYHFDFQQHCWAIAKNRAEKHGLEFTIKPEDIKIVTHCKYLGLKLTFNIGKGLLPTAASLDRIDNTKGYTPDNIQLISFRANSIKQKKTHKEFIEYIKQNYYKNPNGSLSTIKNEKQLQNLIKELEDSG